jgi:hypothetical protein
MEKETNLEFNETASSLFEASEKIRKENTAILDRELLNFLRKHNLPADREEIKKAGYEILTELGPIENLESGFSSTTIYKLVKVVDKFTLVINSKINIT